MCLTFILESGEYEYEYEHEVVGSLDWEFEHEYEGEAVESDHSSDQSYGGSEEGK